MKKLNYPLILGTVIVLFLAMVSIYPELFSKSDAYGVERSKFVFINEEINYFSPPVAPCKEYPWGTDSVGRDMRSLIIYGCRLTIVTAIAVVLGRFIIALPLAILAGYKKKWSMWLIKQFNVLFSAFPLIIVILILSRIRVVGDFFKQANLAIGFMLVVFGWSRLAILLWEKVDEILSQDFIEGEIALGKNRWEIALQNIIPHIIPTILVLFFLEVAAVLLMMTQIGVFGVVLNGGFFNELGDLQLPYSIDWATLLTASSYYIMLGMLWLLLYPAAAFSLAIVGFNLFGEGLRIEFDKRDSKVITWIRRIPSWVSPFRLAYEIKNMEVYRRRVYTKAAIYGLILLFVFFPNARSPYAFNTNNALKTVRELTDSSLKGRRAGSGSNQVIAKQLAAQMKAYGLKPYDKDYIQSYPINIAFNIDRSQLKVFSKASGETELQFRKDYIVTTPVSIKGRFAMKYITPEEFGQFPFNENDFIPYRDKIVLADARGLNDIAFGRYIGLINNMVKPKGLIYISDWKSEKEVKKNGVDYPVRDKDPVLNIAVSSETGDELRRLADSELYLDIQCHRDNNAMGANVVGYIEGSDPALKDEIIIVGSRYDYVGDDLDAKYAGAMEAAGTAVGMETARIVANSKVKPKRTVIFAFWDGSYTGERGSERFIHDYLKDTKKKVFYIDLKNFGNRYSKKILLDTTNTLPKDLVPQAFIKDIKKNARRDDVSLEYGITTSTVVADFKTADINAIIFDSNKLDKEIKTSHDTVENLNEKVLKKSGQLVVDAVYDIVCGGIR